MTHEGTQSYVVKLERAGILSTDLTEEYDEAT